MLETFSGWSLISYFFLVGLVWFVSWKYIKHYFIDCFALQLLSFFVQRCHHKYLLLNFCCCCCCCCCIWFDSLCFHKTCWNLRHCSRLVRIEQYADFLIWTDYVSIERVRLNRLVFVCLSFFLDIIIITFEQIRVESRTYITCYIAGPNHSWCQKGKLCFSVKDWTVKHCLLGDNE